MFAKLVDIDIGHQLAGNDEPGNDYDRQNCETSNTGTFWCPLSVTLNDKAIWSNKLSNSVLFCCPLCLLREKENRENVLEHLKPCIDAAHEMETPSKFNISDTEIDLSVDTEISIIDDKIF